MSPMEFADVEIRALAAGGSGIADLPDGRIVFVPRTAPGDSVRIRIVKKKRRWALGVVESITEPSSDRSDPLCKLYDRCGGCALQHIPYEDQLRWKGQFVADALMRIGGQDVDPPTVEPSDRRTHYRNRVTFTLRRLPGGRLVAGFHALDRPAHVLDIHQECVLPEEAIGRVWRALRASWGPDARLLPAGGRLSLTLRATTDGVVLVIEGGHSGWDPSELEVAVPSLRALWHRPSRAETPTLVAGENVEDVWGPDRFPVGGRAFLQVNRVAAPALVDHVVAEAGEGTGAVDAYCGVGLYGRALARSGWSVTGIELDPAACLAARTDPPEGFTVTQGTVEKTLAAALPADLVILNPPRPGLHADVSPILLQARPDRIIYVSCDPATLARDTAALAEGYTLTGIRAFDLFPQTAHVETVAVFQARDDA